MGILQTCKFDRCEGCIDRGLSRRYIFIWISAILFANQILYVYKNISLASIETLITDLCEIGIFQYMAWYAVFRLLSLSHPDPVGCWRDLLTGAALCLLIFVPTNRMIWIAATGIGIYIWIFNGGDLKLRGAGVVLTALSVQEFWGHNFFDLVAIPLLHAETAVVGTMLEATQGGTGWQENVITGPNGHGIIIYPFCSSFHNLSLALLCWVTVSRLRYQNWQARDLVMGCIIAGTMILLNVGRLYMMALSADLYHFWHDGTGYQIFAVGASLTILLLSLYGLRPTARPS